MTKVFVLQESNDEGDFVQVFPKADKCREEFLRRIREDYSFDGDNANWFDDYVDYGSFSIDNASMQWNEEEVY